MGPEKPVLERMQDQITAWEAVEDRRFIFLSCYAMMTENMLSAIQARDFEDVDLSAGDPSEGAPDPEVLAWAAAESRVLIHATPVGMHPREDESLVRPEWMHAELAVMDIVYNPYRTRLLKDADARELQTIPGIEMFVNQALLQFEAWTGERAPRQVMKQVVLDHLTR